MMEDHTSRCSILIYSWFSTKTRCHSDIGHSFFNSLVDSIHGGSGHEGMTPLDQQYQLFASAGAINFPVQETEAWKEKVIGEDLL